MDGVMPGAENTPFAVPSVQAAKDAAAGKLPGSPHISGSADSQPAKSAPQAVMDHKRAFQAVNAETLEVALQDIDYELPPHKVLPLIPFLPFLISSKQLQKSCRHSF